MKSANSPRKPELDGEPQKSQSRSTNECEKKYGPRDAKKKKIK